MKTIEEAAREHADIKNDVVIDEYERYYNRSVQKYDSFKAGAEFAQRWVSVDEELPEENETVWLYSENGGYVWLGCRVYLQNEGWFWAETNGVIYAENGKIVSECNIEDLDVTHFCKLPKLPTK